jgi:hypothetical protein
MFSNPLDPYNKVISSKINEWLLYYEIIEPDTYLEILEKPHCNDRQCPDISTTITWNDKNGAKIQLTICKPLFYIRKWDIENHLHAITYTGFSN